MNRIILTLAVFCLLLCGHSTAQQNDPQKIRFVDQIEAYLKADETKPPQPGGILFIGSSIFRRWEKLTQQMTPLPVFNRAFGGSRTEEILQHMDKIVLPYKPRIIVYYCGSNDINADIKPEQIGANFKEFAKRVHAQLPQTKIFYVSINRAPQKMERWDWVDDANRRIKDSCDKDKKLGFIDVNPALFDKDGKPRMELYLPDKLHFQEPAYDEFTKIIKPVLEKAWQAQNQK